MELLNVKSDRLSVDLRGICVNGTTEHVLVVPTELFRSLGYFEGFPADAGQYLESLLDPLHTSYRARADMEEDPSFKQLIPYVVIRHRQESGDAVFAYTRGSGQGEARLHAKRSIGIGGHISTLDEHSQDPYLVGMQRELDEEVCIQTTWTQKCVGLINDDSNEVGKVHLGVVHILDVDESSVTPREDDLCEAGFYKVSELLEDIDRFETWSQICLRALFEQD